MPSSPKFLQGVYSFTGIGLSKPTLISPELAYTVPAGITCQPLYFRGGNSADQLTYVALFRDGSPMRWFPMGARASVNVPLRVVEDVDPDSELELMFAAPDGVTGEFVIDFGFVEF